MNAIKLPQMQKMGSTEIGLLLLYGFAAVVASQQFHCISLTGIISLCPNGGLRPVVWPTNIIAYARYANRINATGWAELEVVTNGAHADTAQAYYAGYLEGALTSQLIASHRANNRMGALFERNNSFCSSLDGFITENLNATIHRALTHSDETYWKEVGLVLYQIAGLDDGAVRRPHPHPHLNIDPCGTYQMNIDTEYDDLQLIKAKAVNPDRETHCSALVKFLPHRGDVLAAHNTWGSYHNMLRILKKYSLAYSTSTASSVTMSSYPGQVFSHDDFYITSQRLVVQETSLEVFDAALWANTSSNEIVLEFIRNTVANRLATNGSEWSTIFARYNSGTYNNQFMILDYKKLVNGTLAPGLLTILEQMPHVVRFEDKTQHLHKFGYWASYNIPAFPDIYKLAGYPKMVTSRGHLYSYDQAPRARIFARDQTKVTNLISLLHLMRYNNFKVDPFAHCSVCSPPYTADYAIASRGDLNAPNGTYPFRAIAFRGTGATDAKMTSGRLVGEGQFVAVAGPTDQGQPAFNWDKFPDKSQLHLDQPNLWMFKPVLTRWQSDSEFEYFQEGN